jgi:LmbE family N-acetylglucosaminyl deacetylase
MGSGKRDEHPDLIVIAAHADDEVIGATSVLLRCAQRCRVVHVTDGAPRNMQDARAAGYASRGAYARARRGELVAALARAGMHRSASQQIGMVDQEAIFLLEVLARTLAELFHREQPSTVITHAYEGGHPVRIDRITSHDTLQRLAFNTQRLALSDLPPGLATGIAVAHTEHATCPHVAFAQLRGHP